MEGTLLVSVAELRSLSDAIFARLQAKGYTHIPVGNRHYWSVFPSDAMGPEEPRPCLGDVQDDLDELRSEVSSDEVSAFWHPFHHLSGLIQLVSRADLNGELVGGNRA